MRERLSHLVEAAVLIDRLRVGPYELTAVPAFVCAKCQPLLGQSVLKRFDLQTTKVQGVEFMLLAPR